MVIDGHVHVWPDHIAARALGTPSPDIIRFGDGTVAGSLAAMDAAGIDRSVCLAVSDTPERLDSANRFVGGLDPARFIAFGSVHAGRSPEENLLSLRAHGARGIKVHPLFQGGSLADPALLEVLDALGDEFPAVFHVGPETAGGDNTRATPAQLAHIIRELPRLPVIAAHFGGYHDYEGAMEHVIGLPVHLDTSWPPTMAAIAPERVRAIIERHGSDRVVFATDWPMADPAAEVAAIEALGLPAQDTEAILGGNLARLLGLAS